MAVHKSSTKKNAKDLAKRYRKKGFNASVKKCKKGWRVYTDRKGKA
jgi:hypothetical protein